NECGECCTLTLEAVKNDIPRGSSEMGTARNGGDLCARGFFGYGAINHKDRLTRPAVKMNGQMLEVTWEWAFEKAASGLKAVIEEYGPSSVGGLISAQCTNEEIYLFQKLMRETIGTPHLDSSARNGYINAVKGLHAVFGTARLLRYEEIEQADCILVFDGGMTETNPITAIKVKEAVKKRKARLITVASVDSRRETYISHLPNMASQHLGIRFGTEGTAILGLTKVVLENMVDSSVPVSLLEKAKIAVENISFEKIEAVTGISEKAFRAAGSLYAGAKRGVLIVGRSVFGSTGGYENFLRISELAILAGQVGRSGTGILPLAKENNGFGAIEMGGVSEFLPGFQSFSSSKKGYTSLEMIDAAARGEIKALYLVGENPLRAFPQKKVAEALQNLELLICQDLFPTETTALADILLPGTSYAEKTGRFTNHEGEIQKVREAIEPVGNAKPDWQIFSILANKIKKGGRTPYRQLLEHQSADEIWKEVVMAMPKAWPKVSDEAISESVLAYSEEVKIEYSVPGAEVKKEGFGLQIGQSLFHSGRMSTYAAGLTELLEKEVLSIHPDDAETLEIEEGEIVSISGGNGAEPIQIPVRFSKKLGRGILFVPEHFNLSIKKLLPLTLDPVTQSPYGDRGNVVLTKIPVAVQ
ncbi:MAG: molybdopterin oxidoreductase family protein, partial [Nitrospiria bacterium]